MAATCATSSRRSPSTLRRAPSAGSPTSRGDSCARRAFRKAPTSPGRDAGLTPPLWTAKRPAGRAVRCLGTILPGQRPASFALAGSRPGWSCARHPAGHGTRRLGPVPLRTGSTVTKTDVTFDSAGITLAGHLYLPDGDRPDTAADRPRPAIVVGHPGSGVKEQAAGLYARRLAERGFVTLAFDAAYQGESGGEARGLEDPAHRVEDLKAAVSYLTTRPEADPDRIGALGICASGGYVLPATGSDHRVKAVATVSAVDIARQFRLGADGTQHPAVFQSMLDTAASARTVAAHGEKPPVLSLFPDTIEQARALGGEHGADGFEYYRTPPGQHPRSASFFDWTSIDKIDR